MKISSYIRTTFSFKGFLLAEDFRSNPPFFSACAMVYNLWTETCSSVFKYLYDFNALYNYFLLILDVGIISPMNYLWSMSESHGRESCGLFPKYITKWEVFLRESSKTMAKSIFRFTSLLFRGLLKLILHFNSNQEKSIDTQLKNYHGEY